MTNKIVAEVPKEFRVHKYRKRQTEGSIEQSCREYAHLRGWTSRKMNGLGFRSWPDRFFIPPLHKFWKKQKGQIRPDSMRYQRFWVEFKRPGEESTPDQVRMQKDLRRRGETVYECDNKKEFIEIFSVHNR